MEIKEERQALRKRLPHGAIKKIAQTLCISTKTVNRFFTNPKKNYTVTAKKIEKEVLKQIEKEPQTENPKFTNVNLAEKYNLQKMEV